MLIKDKIYDFFVRRNEKVMYEYERYVMEHITEHYVKRIRHWRLLIKLNCHYVIKRKTTPLLYWDQVNPASTIKEESKDSVHKLNEKNINISSGIVEMKLNEVPKETIGMESKMSKRSIPAQVARELLKYDVISFDIFDTVLFRMIENPTDAFIMLEEQNKIFDFAKLRKIAESEARENLDGLIGSRDVTIYEIYEFISREICKDVKQLIEEEFELEKKLCFANNYIKTIIEILKEFDKEIIFVSDMYYPEEKINLLLSYCEINLADKIYVSCDYRKSKRKGNLYEKIKSDYGRDKTICHVGDNKEVDINMAEKHGLATYYYRNVNSIGRKNRPKDMSHLVRSVYSGIVNTWIHGGEKVFSPQYEYGFIYGGIYVLGYVNWIHEYAKKNKLDKILFLARDSDILLEVYNLLYKDIPSEYLYWGRLPSLKYMIKEDKYGFLKRNIQDRVNRKSKIGIGHLLNLLDLDMLLPYLKNYNLKKDDLLTKDNSQLVKALFINHMDTIENVYEEEAGLAYEYVKYTVGKSKKIGIVDIGWKGTEPLTLKRLIIEKWKLVDDVKCLMAGSYGNKWNVQNGDFDVYMFSQCHNVNNMNFLQKNVSYYTLAFELFGRMRCEARFKGFSSDGGKPYMNFEGNLIENHKDMHQMRKGILDFILEYKERTKPFNYLRNISGYDAYAPSKWLSREKKFLERYFSDHKIELDAGDNEGHIRTYIEYINENNF